MTKILPICHVEKELKLSAYISILLNNSMF